MTEHEQQPGTRLDTYLDGVMSKVERAQYERKAESDDELRTELELQRDIDRSLVRLFTPPSADADQSSSYTLPAPAKRSMGAPPQRWAAAAAIVAGGVGVWLTFSALKPSSVSDPYGPWRSVEVVYADSVANDMEPEWICETEQEFADSIRSHFDYAVVIPFDLPQSMTAIGLAYCNSISQRTICLLAKVNDEPVIVFIDRFEADFGQTIEESSGLNLFNRRIGRLVLYELSPLEKPALLELFYDPDADSTSPIDPP